MSFKYSLTYLTRTKVIDPKSVGKIIVAREDNEIFFREKMSGSVELTGEDYEFLLEAQKYSLQCCQEIALTIESVCNTGIYELFWEGFFTLYDISWDLNNQTAIIKKVSTKDKYTPVFANYEKEINWISGAISARPGQVVPDLQEVVSFTYPYPKTDEYNPRGADYQDRARYFNYALKVLIKRTMAGTSYESYADTDPFEFSQFFNNSINPVTGKSNYLKEVLILHLSDAKRPRASNPAEIGTVTLKSILDDLKIMFNAYWFVDDATGKIRIEHISYFPQQTYGRSLFTLDLTDPKFKAAIDGKLQYSYQVDKLKGIEGFEFSISESARDSKSEYHSRLSDATNEFDAAYMNYSESCVPRNDKGEKTTEYKTVNNFCTNWSAITLRPDTITDSGWALFRVTFESTSIFPKDRLAISKVLAENGCLSATNLYMDFGRYDSSFAYGIFSAEKEKPKSLTNTQVQVTERPLRNLTTKRIKTITDVELSICCGDSYDFSGSCKAPTC